MKKFLFFPLMLFLANCAIADGGIEFFHGSWEELLDKAKSEEKLIFVDVYTDWCGPCKMMSSVVFPQNEVGSYYNSKFINYKLNAEDEDENGPELAKKYNVEAYPTYLYIDSDGKLIHTAVGYIDSLEFILEGKKATGDARPYSEIEKDYNSGNRSPEIVRSYLIGADIYADEGKAKKELEKIASDYLSSKPKEEWINRADYAIGKKYFSSRNDEFVEFLVKNYDKFSKVISPMDLAAFVTEINTNAIFSRASKGDRAYLQYLKDVKGPLAEAYRIADPEDEAFATLYGLTGETLEETYEIHSLASAKNYALSQSEFDQFWKFHEEHVSKVDKSVKNDLNMAAVLSLANSDCKNIEVLEKAVSHAEKLVENKFSKVLMAPDYVTLLMRLSKEKAKKALNEAIKGAKEIGHAYAQSQAEKALSQLN